MTRLNSIDELERLIGDLAERDDRAKAVVRMCMTGCRALGAIEVYEAFAKELEHTGMANEVRLVKTGCQGLCARAPVMTIDPWGYFYGGVTPEDVPEIVERTLAKGEVIERLCCVAAPGGSMHERVDDIPFFANQKQWVLGRCGKIDPTSVEDYLANGGYKALANVLRDNDPDRVIAEVSNSGLRGRGGAGFPTGRKWGFCRAADGEPKYLICNADEGDPGAFMDRAVLEGDPHSVLEGMLIAAFAIGASRGFIYVRAEYPIAIEHMGIAINQGRELGLVGENILETGFTFDVEMKQGAGAFVCGEETALIASIEGRRGMPRVRPPFPANSGLWGKPTNINNVETLANVPYILLHGAQHYRQLGTEGSPGTKIFALAGKVNNTGLVEVPMGSTLRHIVFDIGGGIPRGRKFKAAQTGGPSGGCVPAQYLDLPIDYDSLKQIGAIMGSGGLIIMDEATCMVDIARYFLDFTQNESCGKCAPCRIGTKRMLDILTRIAEGKGELKDLDTLEQLAHDVQAASLCALGKTAPNPVLSTLRYFRDEYLAHIIDKRCPAGVCKALVKSPCQNACPAGVNAPQYIALVRKKKFQRAADLVRRRNPFAATCGRVCNHPCETFCRRGDLDEAVAIMQLKRVAADHAKRPGNVELKQAIVKTGKKVAVVGAGPAGLSAAYFLALQGHRVVVLEAMDEPGGMLVVGVPSYRLPREALQQDINYIRYFGVKIHTGVRVGRDVSLAELRRKYDAVFISVGAHVGLRLGVPGEDAAGVMDGVEFLRKVNLGENVAIGRRVVVVGGGNVAMDASRTAIRLGAESVTVLYRRTEAEMPALKDEVHEAEEEGVKFDFLCAPIRVLTENGTVRGVTCVRMRLGEPDESLRRRPVPIEGSEFDVACDTVIQAIGQRADLTFVEQDELPVTGRGLIEIDPRTLRTPVEGVFAGGDCTARGGTVVEAVAAGQRAAVTIDRYLGGKGELPPNFDLLAASVRPAEQGMQDAFRPPLPHLPMEQRRCRFDEVQLGYDPAAAVAEAKRCLRCDLEEA